MNNLGLTQEQVSELLCGLDVYKDENDEKPLFEFVDKKPISFDVEKSSGTYKVIIEETATGIKYFAMLGESQWYMQNEANADVEWQMVSARKSKSTNNQSLVEFAKWIDDSSLHGWSKQVREAMIIYKVDTIEELVLYFMDNVYKSK